MVLAAKSVRMLNNKLCSLFRPVRLYAIPINAE